MKQQHLQRNDTRKEGNNTWISSLPEIGKSPPTKRSDARVTPSLTQQVPGKEGHDSDWFKGIAATQSTGERPLCNIFPQNGQAAVSQNAIPATAASPTQAAKRKRRKGFGNDQVTLWEPHGVALAHRSIEALKSTEGATGPRRSKWPPTT